MRLLIFFICVLFLSLNLLAVKFNVDSLKKLLDSEKNPEKRIELMNLIGEYGGIERTTYWDSIIANSKNINYYYGVTYSSFMQSIVYTKKGKYDNAVDFAEQALNYAKKYKDTVWMGYAIEHLGSLNSYINEKQTALNYYNDALKLYEAKKLSWRKGFVTIRLGEIYESDGNTTESMKLYQNSLNFFLKNKDTSGISNAYNKIGKLFRNINNLDSAHYYLKKAIDSRNKYKDEYYLCSILNDLAFVNLDLGKKELAYKYILDSQKEAERIGEKGRDFRDINFFLYRYHKSKKKFELSLRYKEVADSLDKVLTNSSNDKAILRQQSKYIYDKQKELDEIQNSKLIAIEREEKEKQQLIIYAACAGLLLLIIFAAFMINRFKVISKQKKLIEKQKHFVDEKQKEILDSINYASRIQKALLPREKYITRNLNKFTKN
ncbi:MAG: tetratricopeptide repeat protein [Bacteroidota bacterium]|nr:tetratricopeptide repeat protein [Bacteroidota bacterium]